MARIGSTKRIYVTIFIVVFVIFVAIHVYRSPNVRKVIPMGFSFYSNDVNNNASRDEPISLQERIEKGEIEQDHPDLIGQIKKHIRPPSTEPYNIDTQDKDTSMGQAAAVKKILKEKRNGFFIECGALDGETRSNTYYFERSLGWQGILIEGDPSNFKLVVNKHRKAYSINACLSVIDTPMKVVFKQSFNIGKIVSDYTEKNLASGFVSVQCYPIYSILLALNRTEVDYFSLDVEGAELDVLKTIPFEKVNIKVLSVEYFHDKDGEVGVKQFMESKGYYAHSKVNNAQNLANDIIFVKNGVA